MNHSESETITQTILLCMKALILQMTSLEDRFLMDKHGRNIEKWLTFQCPTGTNARGIAAPWEVKAREGNLNWYDIRIDQQNKSFPAWLKHTRIAICSSRERNAELLTLLHSTNGNLRREIVPVCLRLEDNPVEICRINNRWFVVMPRPTSGNVVGATISK